MPVIFTALGLYIARVGQAGRQGYAQITGQAWRSKARAVARAPGRHAAPLTRVSRPMGLVGFIVRVFKDHAQRIMARTYRPMGDMSGRMVRFARARGTARDGSQYDYWQIGYHLWRMLSK